MIPTLYLGRFARLLLFVSFGIYCFIYPSSLFLLMTGSVPAGTEWMATLMLVLEGLIAITWVTINYAPWRGLVGALAVLVVAFSIEALGVYTGFPFGPYYYTEVLSPKILVVPIGITFAWLMIVLSSFFTARFLVERLWPRRGLFTVLLLGITLAVLSDLLMEPVAVHIQGYWTWLDGGFYYGIPTSNFVAWVFTSLLLMLVLVGITGRGRLKSGYKGQSFSFNFVPLSLFMMNLVMFGAINLSYGNFLAGFIGIVVGGSCTVLLVLARRVGKTKFGLAARRLETGVN